MTVIAYGSVVVRLMGMRRPLAVCIDCFRQYRRDDLVIESHRITHNRRPCQGCANKRRAAA